MRARQGGRGRRASFARGFGVAACGLLLGVAAERHLASKDPTKLVVEPQLLARLQTLAAGLHNEIVLCLDGRVRGDTAFASTFDMPTPRESSPTRSSFDPCPPGTLASWHNHPPSVGPARTVRATLSAARRAQRLCVLSETDIATARRLGYPFVVVAVDGRTWCWWTLAEVEAFASSSIAPGPPAPGRIASHAAIPTWSKPVRSAGESAQD
ncbi:MAG: hypothetical protein MJB57_16540 [Gemmatimonadetes bacterium]|nr:hypothetical protein [Gemmatimonadota bacterium]